MTTLSRCVHTISEEIDKAPDVYPPVAGEPYVEVVEIGTSAEGSLAIKALRIGELWTEGEDAVPQLVVFAAQHAREWVTTEFAMRLLRYFAGSYRDNVDDVRDLLDKVAILIVPVSNPDGYEHTHTTGGRLWRPNREPCEGGRGTDINRNHAFTWDEPGANPGCSSSENSTYQGPTSESASESNALEVAFSNDGLTGKYITHFSLNTHAYANLVFFPEGLSSGFGPCTTNSNCTAADLGVFYDLVGTERASLMSDEETNLPYITASTFRSLYATSGDATTEHVYGTIGLGYAPNHLGAGIELTNTECTYYAEQIPDGDLDILFERFRRFVADLLKQVPGLQAGTFFEDYQLPHLHRRSPSGAGGLAEQPTLRVARRGFGPVDFLADGTAAQDDVLRGVAYEMWRFRSADPYVFPTVIPVCAEGFECREAVLADPGDGVVKLCDTSPFDGGATGWTFHGDVAGGPQNECYWEFDASSGSAPWQLTSSVWSIGGMEEAHLVYSFRWNKAAVIGEVIVSNNGFVGCSETGYGTCRIVRRYPYGATNHDGRDSQYRTEIIDVSDFDGSANIQVRFRITAVNTAPSQPWLDVYDPVIVGWAT